jgi:hypothetical protein
LFLGINCLLGDTCTALSESLRLYDKEFGSAAAEPKLAVFLSNLFALFISGLARLTEDTLQDETMSGA